MLTQLSALAICQLCLGIQHGRETEIDPSHNEGVVYNFALFDSTLVQKEGVESLLATKHQMQEHMPSTEEFGAFLDEKMSNLAEVIAEDPFKATYEIQRRVKELRLRPIKTTDGLSFEVSFSFKLLASSYCHRRCSSPETAFL